MALHDGRGSIFTNGAIKYEFQLHRGRNEIVCGAPFSVLGALKFEGVRGLRLLAAFLGALNLFPNVPTVAIDDLPEGRFVLRPPEKSCSALSVMLALDAPVESTLVLILEAASQGQESFDTTASDVVKEKK